MHLSSMLLTGAGPKLSSVRQDLVVSAYVSLSTAKLHRRARRDQLDAPCLPSWPRSHLGGDPVDESGFFHEGPSNMGPLAVHAAMAATVQLMC